MELIIIILFINYGFAAFISSLNGQALQQQASQQLNDYSQFNYIHPQQVYSSWGINQQPQQYFQPSYSNISPSSYPPQSSIYNVPYAAYRNSAFSLPTTNTKIDSLQKQQLATISDQTEDFNSGRKKSEYFSENNSENGIQRILKTVAEKLPKIAETMSKIGSKDEANLNNIDKKEQSIYSLNKREYNLNLNNNKDEQSEQPEQQQISWLSSFNKLFSAFNSGNQKQKTLKSEELSPELIYQQQKRQIINKEEKSELLPTEQEQIIHLTPPPELPSPSQQNPLNSFLQQFGISNLILPSSDKNIIENNQNKNKKDENNNSDLFLNLMNGKLPQMPDILNQFGFDSIIGGGGSQNKDNNEQQKSGNALAQIFGGKKDFNKNGGGGPLSSFFGSGLDDTPR